MDVGGHACDSPCVISENCWACLALPQLRAPASAVVVSIPGMCEDALRRRVKIWAREFVDASLDCYAVAVVLLMRK
jgi:hypothetical protein